MTRIRPHFIAVAISLFFGAASASTVDNRVPPLNRPPPGWNAAPYYTTTGQGLGVALLGALVTFDGSLLGGAGATGAVHIATGQYEIDFNRDVSNCFYSAAGFYETVPSYVEPRAGNVKGVFLITRDNSGADVDSRFYVTVICNK